MNMQSKSKKIIIPWTPQIHITWDNKIIEVKKPEFDAAQLKIKNASSNKQQWKKSDNTILKLFKNKLNHSIIKNKKTTQK